MFAYHPNILLYIYNFGAFGEQCHTMCCSKLLRILCPNPFAISSHFTHASNGFLMMHQFLIERFGERFICDICINNGLDGEREKDFER